MPRREALSRSRIAPLAGVGWAKPAFSAVEMWSDILRRVSQRQQSGSGGPDLKNQYFGDRRDFFKYDLLLDLTECHGSRRLTLIPMLTPNDESIEGNLTKFECGGRRRCLHEFLRNAVAWGRRDVTRLREIMLKLGVEFMPYRDDEYFAPTARGNYFDEAPIESLANSVIFFDPTSAFRLSAPVT